MIFIRPLVNLRHGLRFKLPPLAHHSSRFHANQRNSLSGSSRDTPPHGPRFSRPTVFAFLTIPTVYIFDRYTNDSTIVRSLRTVCVIGGIVAVYKLYNSQLLHGLISPYLPVTTVHEGTSSMLLYLLQTNKGVYIKFGQMIALQANMFPAEFVTKFKQLYEHNEPDAWGEINATLRAELGPDYSRHFAHICESPISSGSVAQVHRATLVTGEEVVLKVQHHALRNQIGTDMACFTLTMKWLGWVFGLPLGFGMDFILHQIQTELQFTNEVQNADTMRALIAHEFGALDTRYYVPKTYRALSTERVITSEHIEGSSLASLTRYTTQFNTRTVVHDLVHIYALQLFKWGVVHCDPHPGNFLIRQCESGREQLVIIDHGLYMTLPKPFQRRYCELWNALTRFDNRTLREISQEWGIGAIDVLPALILLQTYKSSGVSSTFDASRDRTDTIKDTFHTFVTDQDVFPLELMFITKTQRSLQNINQHFGSVVNRLKTLSLVAAASLHEMERESNRKRLEFHDYTVINYCCDLVGSWVKMQHALLNVYVSDIIFFKALRVRQEFTRVWNRVVLFITGHEGGELKGSEDILEGMLRFVAKEYVGLDIVDDGPVLFEG
ncbi:hypothetical protein BABINDRAFT_161110 [Babjeviella inositovora NRRL Y-12698]|uniref:ABC1 atypical kinase-like domain-containing protein n=1 Tax=Babjeviella inositovora NRRL Y-12698 TaxID=984486 RepID=A0A1E3QQZ8_9ASCO|nr:uncharacterized protein BABINDRAFT_161110 [Babjeviella inositovora NRRL Y-12698]ODQ80123.1 hypothetical protein BABINDRAFT_161110 [Babjeviella inositovora NRRL Y-12698]